MGNLDTDIPPSEEAMEATRAASLFTVSPIRGRVTRWRRQQLVTAARIGGDQLRALGVRGVLVKMAERGQLLAVRCEMPQCYHHKGRGAFDPVTTPRTKWVASPDHYPILKSAGGTSSPKTFGCPTSGVTTWTMDGGRGPDDARERQVPRRHRRGSEQQRCPPGPRYEPLDGRDGAQGLCVVGLAEEAKYLYDGISSARVRQHGLLSAASRQKQPCWLRADAGVALSRARSFWLAGPRAQTKRLAAAAAWSGGGWERLALDARRAAPLAPRLNEELAALVVETEILYSDEAWTTRSNGSCSA